MSPEPAHVCNFKHKTEHLHHDMLFMCRSSGSNRKYLLHEKVQSVLTLIMSCIYVYAEADVAIDPEQSCHCPMHSCSVLRDGVHFCYGRCNQGLPDSSVNMNNINGNTGSHCRPWKVRTPSMVKTAQHSTAQHSTAQHSTALCKHFWTCASPRCTQ